MENYWDFIAPIYRTSELLTTYPTSKYSMWYCMGTFLPIFFETPFKVDQLPKASGTLLITNLYCAAYHIIGLYQIYLFVFKSRPIFTG